MGRKVRKKPRGAFTVRCPWCVSGFYFYRSTTDDFRCRKCGKLFKVEWEKERITKLDE